jgi:hypothetical protein
MRIFHWCENVNYHQILENSFINDVRFPWNDFGNSQMGKALLAAMNNFKDNDGGKDYNTDYNVYSVVALLRFVSGLYAHCWTINAPVSFLLKNLNLNVTHFLTELTSFSLSFSFTVAYNLLTRSYAKSSQVCLMN